MSSRIRTGAMDDAPALVDRAPCCTPDASSRKATALPTLVSLREWQKCSPEPTRWRIDGWQPVGSRTILAAPAKAGKTSLAANYVRCLLDGDPFLGKFAVAPIAGTIALVDFEMGTAQLVDWLGRQEIRHDDRLLVVPMRGSTGAFNILDASLRATWAARFREAGVTALVVDCLRPILDALGLDEHRDAGRFLVALDALLREAGISECLLIHHMGHTGERSRGDSRLRDWPDVEWRLVRQSDDPASPRYLAAYGRDVDQPETRVTYDSDTRRFAVGGGSRQDTTTRAALAEVIRILTASTAPLSARAIQLALASGEHPRDRIRDAIRLGVRERTIITEAGARRALLHRLPVNQTGSVSECAVVREPPQPRTASECAAAYIEPRTRTLVGQGKTTGSLRALAALAPSSSIDLALPASLTIACPDADKPGFLM